MSKKLTKEEFIQRAKEIHGNTFDYSLVEYTSNKIKVKIVCPTHGVFLQRPDNHIGLKQGCSNCKSDNHSIRYSKTVEVFIEQCKNTHGDKYDYSKVVYKKSTDKISISCAVHGDFEQEANSHLQGHGCPTCGIEKNTKLPIELRPLRKKVRGVIQQSFIRKNFPKNSKTHDLLKCTWDEFKAHLEDNPYGFNVYQEGLDLDHIVPICSAKTEEDMIELNHYTNFQLLPSAYNRNIKKDKPFDKKDFENWLEYSNNKL